MSAYAPILFLDIDGVLNSAAWFTFESHRCKGAVVDDERMFDPAAVERLNRITDAVGAVIVVSSAWRLKMSLAALRELLTRVSVTATVIDRTPTVYPRGRAIQQWLTESGHSAPYVILDDDAVEFLSRRQILTTWSRGLEDEHVEPAIALLRRPL